MFKKALPIWLENKEKEKNIQAKFEADFIGEECTILKITGATFYKVFLNGNLIHYGPSPTAGGYARVDVIKLDVNSGEKNTILVEAAGYNCYTYAAVKQISYIQAEILCHDKCIAATGYDFTGYFVASKVQKTMRYSFQRHFTEVWDMTKEDIREAVSIQKLDLKYLERRAPLPDIDVEQIKTAYSKSEFLYTENDWRISSLQGATDNIGDEIDGFELNDIVHRPIKELSNFNYNITAKRVMLPCGLSEGEFAAFECGKNTCGMINLRYKADGNCKIIIAFDEKLIDGKFDYKNWETFNVIEVNSAGETNFTNFEVYGFKYFAVFVVEGTLEIEEVNVVKIRNPIKNPPKLNCEDEEILKIYASACESARCNSLAIFMDCPTRERAGWLCDSYFAAQAAYTFSGNTYIEDDFIENFTLAKCDKLPKGMLPMCYPADHPNGNYIPQWAMWFILQLDQYKGRNKNVNIEEYKQLSYNLLKHFESFENEFQLLENLSGWNFVEWSEANAWTEGINFPTNMLYCHINKIIGGWFNDKALITKSEMLKRKIIELSFDGKFFGDQALRNQDNVPILCEHISEVCQYYAFMFEIADRENFNELYKMLVTDFVPGSENWNNIEKANAFMGMYMRMELLLKWGHKDQLLKEIKMFFGHMSDITGTLWEHKHMTNSLNHGFTAYLCVLLLEIFNK